jgi:hypothetical protein
VHYRDYWYYFSDPQSYSNLADILWSATGCRSPYQYAISGSARHVENLPPLAGPILSNIGHSPTRQSSQSLTNHQFGLSKFLASLISELAGPAQGFSVFLWNFAECRVIWACWQVCPKVCLCESPGVFGLSCFLNDSKHPKLSAGDVGGCGWEPVGCGVGSPCLGNGSRDSPSEVAWETSHWPVSEMQPREF